jgi:hypothetical protein
MLLLPASQFAARLKGIEVREVLCRLRSSHAEAYHVTVQP